MDNNVNEVIEIDIKELFMFLIRRFWILLISGAALASAAFLISAFVLQPTYQSSTKIYILNKQKDASTITYSDLQSGAQLTKDYMTLVKSRPVIEQVINELSLDMKYKELAGLVSVNNPVDTRLLNITVEYNDPILAKKIADSVREASSAHIKEVMDIEQVNTAEEANIPEEPASPGILRNTILGGMAGVLLTGLILLLIYILDDTLKNPDDIEKYLGISVLGSIPMQDMDGRKKKDLSASKEKQEIATLSLNRNVVSNLR